MHEKNPEENLSKYTPLPSRVDSLYGQDVIDVGSGLDHNIALTSKIKGKKGV